MPVHKVSGGYRWGKHGKVYKSRAGAERQARAIYASGYRDDADELLRAQARVDWNSARRAEIQYGIQLRTIARHCGDIVRMFPMEDPQGAMDAASALRRYADTLSPWAEASARRMVLDIAARTDVTWRKLADEMGRNFRDLFAGESDLTISSRYWQLMADQVTLIRSIPLDGAERIHKLVTEGVVEGVRFTSIASEIQRTYAVSRSKANLIARTETGRVISNLTQARAESAGSPGYVWRTVRDADVRHSHRMMEGQFVRWDSPPTLDGL